MDSTTSFIILLILVLVVGLSVLFILKKILETSISSLFNEFAKQNVSFTETYKKSLEQITTYVMNNHSIQSEEMKSYNEFLKKELDKFSESMSKYRSSISSLNSRVDEIIIENQNYMKELRNVSLKDLTNINESLKAITENYVKIENNFQKQSESINAVLSVYNNVIELMKASDKNLDMVVNLNNNFDGLLKHFGNVTVQMELVSRSVQTLAHTSLDPLVKDLEEIIPSLKRESTSISDKLYGKFSDTIDEMEKIVKAFNETTRIYNELLEGSKKDPITNRFLNNQ
jgi:methyl-accepting chemotaxis protein